MKKFIVLLSLVAFIGIAQAQYTTVANEKFSSLSGWTVNPTGGWIVNTNLSVSSPSSALGFVPNSNGDSIELISPWYDLRNYEYVFLQFSHICKTSTSDMCQVKYQELAMPGWKVIPTSSYQGTTPAAYAGARFSQASYLAWMPHDSLATPNNSWWKEESFDVSGEVSYAQVRFKFIIKKGNVIGTQFAYGWAIDNFKLLASANPIQPPVVEFLSSSPVDTVYNTGPFTVTAKIATRTFARIVQPVKLNVSYTYNSITTYDTLTMTMVEGDSIFSAIIPQKVFGTTITYDVRGVDSVGNDATAYSSFYIKRAIGGAATGYIIAGTGTLTQYYSPFYRYYDYGWSRNLYLANELSLSGGGGMITKLAWHVSTTGVSGSNQTCYFQAVNDNSISSNAWIDPATSGATQVWTGTFNPSTTGWVEINLDNPFMLPPGQNLLIYWTNYNGSYTTPYAYWTSTSTSPAYMSVYKYQDGSFPASAGTYNYNRPNARFYVVGGLDDTNSVALYRIESPGDSVVAAPSHQSPVIVTIKNKGMGDLDSCLINWTLNGVAQPTYTWRGNLPDDFNTTDTIGYYTPSVNQYDTLVIWTSMPNGVYDSTTFDDTLMRVAFGVPDLAMGFTTDEGDTVYNTGPFEVIAEIYSRMGALTPSPINLHLTYINDTTYSYDTLLMTSIGNNLYKTIIPQHIFGTDVIYTLTLTDTLGNIVSISDRFFIKRLSGGGVVSNDSVLIGSISTGGANCLYPFCTNADSTKTRTLYFASEIGNISNAVVITGIAFYNASYNYANLRTNQKCYLKAVSDTSLTLQTDINPVADGATLVYTGGWTTHLDWNKFTFDRPFVLPAGRNLIVYWVDKTGSCLSANTIYWRYSTGSVPRSESQYYNWNCANTGHNLVNNQVVATIYFGGGGSDDSNSVALHEIVSPTSAITAGQTTPVIATIKNKGMANLTSCTIKWKLNGVLQPTINWTGNLPEDFNSTDTLGYYTPRNSMFDTIIVWVSYPNGVYDSIYYDDTLSIITFGCGQILTGDIIVGPDTTTSDFFTLTELLDAIKLCGTSGSITAKLQSGLYAENIIIDDLSTFMGTDTLFITSLAGNADSVIFQVSSGVALTLNNAKNVYINHITWDATLGTYGVQLTGTGDNIEIYGCNIKANPTSTSSSNVGVYYGNSSGSGKYMTNVRFIKNGISGGYYNMYFYYSGSGTATMGLSSITIDSNTLTDAYSYGIYSYYYGNYPSISHNTITSRYNTPSSYYGIYTYYYHNILALVGNRIKVTGSSTCYGMYLYYYHNYSTAYGSTGPGLLSNNEVIVLGGSTTAYGIYMYGNSRWDMTHNTIYVQGTSTCYGLYRYNTTTGYPMNVNKNILATHTSGTGYPLYISSATYGPVAYGSINYNNYYSNGPYIAYVGNTISTIAALKLATTQDTNSINIYPNFIDSTSNLDLVDYTGFDCPQDPAVMDDINGYPRLSTTTIGAHCLMLVNINANMKGVLGWESQAMAGRNFGVNAILENDGLTPLTSATINWSFNNVVKTPVNWTGNLATSQSANVYLGNVTFLQGDSNNLVVWVTNPNNTTDMYPANDTLRLSSVGGAGVLVEFITPFVIDTLVGNTGPYEINARVKSLSQQPLTTPVLNVYTLWQGTPSYANITMTAVSGDSLWKATIPQKAYGSHVEYSITAYDSLGAMATDTAWFYVKRGASGGTTGTIVAGDTTSGSGNLGKWFHINAAYSWSRNLYYHTELNTTLTGGTILKFAMYNKNYNLIYTRANQKIYMMAVDSMLLTYNNYIDPSTIGATLVWTGGITTQQYWNEVTLQTPFNLPPNKNLLVYFVDETGYTAGNSIYWTTSTTTNNSNAYGHGTSLSNTSMNVQTTRGIARFEFGELFIDDSNSVALTKIISPTDTAPCFQNVPIEVVIKNRGIKNLTSCDIHWTRNGVPQTTYQWTGNLAEDFIDTVLLGTYTPSFGVTDNFRIWVSQPNGQLDSINYDDTLTRNAYGHYVGGNVVAKAILEPANVGAVCFENKTALKVKLENVGTRAIMLFAHPITFYYTISGSINIQDSITFTNGIFGIEEKEFILDSLDISMPGSYAIDIIFYCDDDVIHTDDTLRMVYDVNKIAMPYDNVFSAVTNDYHIANSGSIGWELDSTPIITPMFGTGALHMASGSGETSMLSFYSINMTGSSYPTIEFWFSHDNLNSSSQDRVVVKVSTNEGLSFTTLQTVYRYRASALTPQWGYYSVDLLNYAGEPCLIIAFEAISAGGGDMWIDRIKINSNNEISVTDLGIADLSDLVACDLSNKSLRATLSNNINQALDFSETPVTLIIEVSGAVNQVYTHTLTTGGIAAHSQMEYEVESNFDYSTSGTYDFKAYVNSIDQFPNNDTMISSLMITPDVRIDSIVDIGCETVGVMVYKTVYIKNEGNISASNIPLRLQIDGASDITETAIITLLPGQIKEYTFITPYTVPPKTTYDLSIITELSCDGVKDNDTSTINCCVIDPFVKVKEIIDPSTTPCDIVNTKKYAIVSLENTASKALSNQVVYLEVDNKAGNVEIIKDTILYLPAGLTNYRFVKPYTVPDLEDGSPYTLTSYVYAPVYGVSIEACVETVGITEADGKLWHLGQNIPNPATASTLIPYTIPNEGKLTFKLTTITGQLLHAEDIQGESGTHYYEFNTESIASGIYYYSMEYKGKKFVKKMTIQK